MTIKDLINFPEEWLNKSKLHLATGLKDKLEPLYAFYRNDFKEWQESQNRKNFELDYIFSLIYYAKNEWLFAGVYKQTNIKKIDNKYFYQTELQDVGKKFIGRLIIKFEKTFRNSYTFLSNHMEKFQLLEILREPYTVAPFPGFENVRVDFTILKSLIIQEEKTWQTALSSVKGIYLITDKTNGKQYVGSGYGEKSLWSRWSDYAKTGHGNNYKLKDLLLKNGAEYSQNFQFSILETRKMNTDKEEVIRREGFWKEILLSRAFGYNIN